MRFAGTVPVLVLLLASCGTVTSRAGGVAGGLRSCSTAGAPVAVTAGSGGDPESTIDLYGIAADGRVRRLTDDGGSSRGAMFPDATKVLFTRGPGGSDAGSPAAGTALWELTVATKRQRLVHDAGRIVREPAVSPDGTRYAVSIAGPRPPYLSRIHVGDVAGGEPRPLLPEDGEVATHDHVVWSPDGTRLAYVVRRADRTESFEIRITPAAGGTTEVVHSTTASIGELDWSRDAGTLLFTEWSVQSMEQSRLVLRELDVGRGHVSSMELDPDDGGAFAYADRAGRSFVAVLNDGAPSELVTFSERGRARRRSLDVPYARQLSVARCALG